MRAVEKGLGVKTELGAYLKELAEQGVLFFRPNPGNAGDSLIACATFQLFEEFGIPYRLFDDSSFDPAGKVVVFGGGGSLVPEYRAAWQFVERYHQAAKKLVILPQTISGHEDLLGQLGSNVDVFVREEVSFEHVQRHAPQANLFLEDDLALSLDVSAVLAADLPRPFRHVPLKQLIRREVALLRAAGCRSDVLNCFRTDKEKTDLRRPYGNADLSKLFKVGTSTPEEALLASHLIFQMLNQYEEVRTNRLHLAIAGALLGKDVKFYPNSYFKNEGVYQFSMKGRFPNVQWMG